MLSCVEHEYSFINFGPGISSNLIMLDILCTALIHNKYLINTFASKHLKKPIPQCQACFKDS